VPKTNVNTANREQLVEAGLRAELADEILKLRRKGKITDPEALGELPGVGPATLDRLRESLAFGEPGRNGDDRGPAGERRDVDRPTRAAAEPALGAARAEDAARHGLHVVQQAAGAVGELEREVARRAAEGTAELGRVLVDLTVAQARQNLETLTALAEAVAWDRVAKAVDWDRVLQIQGEYLRVSLERAGQLTQRYLEVSQAVVTQAASVARREAKKAA
jgi:Helix-hairpin-helix motif